MITLDVRPLQINDDAFGELCSVNRDLRLERTAQGELLIMSPVGGETGNRNSHLLVQVWLWNEQSGLGVVFDSSTGFALPNGARRSPDVAWVVQARWEALTAEERRRFPPLCPDVVLELRSPSDMLSTVQQKMREYMEQGAMLGWLIDPERQCVEVYRVGQAVAVLARPARLSGNPVLPGFVLDLQRIW
jgi:Uma2 family endonuclease